MSWEQSNGSGGTWDANRRDDQRWSRGGGGRGGSRGGMGSRGGPRGGSGGFSRGGGGGGGRGGREGGREGGFRDGGGFREGGRGGGRGRGGFNRHEESSDEKSSFAVPSSEVGRIIGRGGSTINNIRDRTGARILVQKQHEAIDGNINIDLFGSEDARNRAKDMIFNIIDNPNRGGGGGGNSGGGDPASDGEAKGGEDW